MIELYVIIGFVVAVYWLRYAKRDGLLFPIEIIRVILIILLWPLLVAFLTIFAIGAHFGDIKSDRSSLKESQKALRGLPEWYDSFYGINKRYPSCAEFHDKVNLLVKK